ncbi:hypothetical protein H9P43_005388 [Blastocladiella emersonii ATCC 22665]|nr:hypothetical protein H9P43_005388 [Blastocladiella emersonii ATCC 22665]
MPAHAEPVMRAAADFAPAIYVPVHADFSQIEYVAPFLEQYKGSKVFVYKWNGIRDKMLHYYTHSPEYQQAQLGVYDFSLKNIVQCILAEPPGRKVVFLLTASMAYFFGEYQRDLLRAVKSALDALADDLEREANGDPAALARARELRGKVSGVSVVGHCSYGCASCKGNDHKVPIYWTRYVKGSIPYTKEHVARQFGIAYPPPAGGQKPIPVLCAPSTGETSVLLHRPILEYLKQLQDAGHYTFVWKLHPAVYNRAWYDESRVEDRTEIENVQWIFANFAVTREDEPCLLPFIEAFPLVFCDLHSSVPFIASYFSPKPIVCYWNDADYEVPAGRDPQFLAGLHVFQHLDELKGMLSPTAVPDPRGDIAFFWSTYGRVDGNEVGRFASLANWPLAADSVPADPTVDLTPVLRRAIGAVTNAWDALLEKVETAAMDLPDDEDPLSDMKSAMGLFSDTQLLPRTPRVPPPIAGQMHDSAVAVNGTTEIQGKRVSVLSLNLWLGGEGCYKSGLLAGARFAGGPAIPAADTQAALVEATARAILAAGADVVGCQETATLPRDLGDHEAEIDRGELGGRTSVLPALARALTALSGGETWTAVDQGILTPGKGNRHPWGVLTRLPVLATSPARFGVQVDVGGGTPAWVFNTHLPYKPYAPYQLIRPNPIAYEADAPLKDAAEAVASCTAARGEQVTALLADIAAATSSNSDTTPVFLTGDFNEPSHRDWTNAATVAGYHPVPVAWPCTSRVEREAGFTDSLRAAYPDPVAHPAWTWCTYGEEMQSGKGDDEGWRVQGDGARDAADRIDFVFHRGSKVQVESVEVVGSAKSLGNGTEFKAVGLVQIAVENDAWPSDHRGVVARYRIAA